MRSSPARRVFVFEYLTGGGFIEGGSAVAAELLPMGLAMRDALLADLLAAGGCSVSVATSERAADLPPALAEATRVHAAPGESVPDFFARQAALHHCTWAVAPETDGVLTQLCRRVEPARWLGCSLAAIRIATSKRATLLRLAGRGIATPLAFERAADVTRWVVKPDDGAGAVATKVHARRAAAWDDVEQRARAGAGASVEPWIEGDALSLSLWFGQRRDAAAVELLAVNRQRIDIGADGGVSYRGVDIAALPLGSTRGHLLGVLAGQVAHALPGLHGFVGVDLVWHGTRGPVVIEVNPRLTCAYVGLSALLGRNLGAELVAAQDLEPADAGA